MPEEKKIKQILCPFQISPSLTHRLYFLASGFAMDLTMKDQVQSLKHQRLHPHHARLYHAQAGPPRQKQRPILLVLMPSC